MAVKPFASVSLADCSRLAADTNSNETHFRLAESVLKERADFSYRSNAVDVAQ